MSIRHFNLFLLGLLTVSVFGTGCVTNGRRVLLKEYGPSIPALAGEPLKGKTIYVKDFTSGPSLTNLVLAAKAEEPLPFKYQDLTHEQDKQWDKEMKIAQKEVPKSDWREIANMRNGFGMVMSHVYALNDPAAWITQGLKYDLEGQGAKVVDASQSADADFSVSGTLQFCHADMYMTISSDIVIDLVIQPHQGEARHRQIHTHGATAAMLGSEGEYFHAFRDAREKISLITVRELAPAVK